jgi:hypothetical protein
MKAFLKLSDMHQPYFVPVKEMLYHRDLTMKEYLSVKIASIACLGLSRLIQSDLKKNEWLTIMP